jgi:GNAT superfamily N-acetyltransferase
MDEQLSIRPARSGDRPAMERICAQTWEWGDYVPGVWEDWLADEQGLVLVGQLGERVVALSKISFLPAGQVWLEGMRVEPDYRRRGIAGRFLDYALAHARQRGARVVRLGTGGHNTAVHIIAARAGMDCIATYVLWVAEPLPDAPGPLFLGSDRAEQVQSFLQGSAVLAHTTGLYSAGWVWQELTARRMAQFLAGGQVVAESAPGGGLAALAVISVDTEDREVWLDFVDGQPASVTVLATAIRAHAARCGAESVRAMLPGLAWLRAAFRAAGYGFGDWEGDLWIFERRLAGEAGGDHDG